MAEPILENTAPRRVGKTRLQLSQALTWVSQPKTRIQWPSDETRPVCFPGDTPLLVCTLENVLFGSAVNGSEKGSCLTQKAPKTAKMRPAHKFNALWPLGKSEIQMPSPGDQDPHKARSPTHTSRQPNREKADTDLGWEGLTTTWADSSLLS